VKDFSILIPARLESTRLPRKLILDETGHPLIWHSLKNLQALRNQAEICLVTDSQELANAVEDLADQVFISDVDHQSGTERITEMLPKIKSEWILNVQADEPEIDPKQLENLMKIMLEGSHEMGTLGVPFLDKTTWENPNAVKVLLNESFEALYFSRSALPWGGSFDSPRVLHHLGVYAYQKALLNKWAKLPKGPFESCEKLEQLRALENGISIVVHQVSCAHKGIDTKEDYQAFVKRTKE